MNILDKYIIKNYLGTFFVMFGLFIPIGIMVDFAEKIGTVNKDVNFVLNEKENITFSIEELRKKWTEPLWNRMA